MRNSNIEIFQSKDGKTQIEVIFENETVWLNRHQIAFLFNRDIKTIGKHINNVFKEGELTQSATVAKFATVQKEGGRKVERKIEHYNLDVIISVGYRVKSHRGTQFRQWATQRIKDFLIQGYAINEKRLAQKQQEVRQLKTGIQILSRVIEEKNVTGGNDWLVYFAKGLELLDDYDHERLDNKGLSLKKAIYPTISEYQALIDDIKKGVDSSLFGKEKDKSFISSLIQITKGYEAQDFYPGLEDKAATLLYLIIKNHSFVDGNKRIAAACFLLFLEKNNMLMTEQGKSIISNEALASLTLFVAASKPDEMEIVKKLIISILNRNKNFE